MSNENENMHVGKFGDIWIDKNEYKSTSFIDREKNGYLSFTCGGEEVIRLEPNGDIFVKGRKVTNDEEVVDGMRELINLKKN